MNQVPSLLNLISSRGGGGVISTHVIINRTIHRRGSDLPSLVFPFNVGPMLHGQCWVMMMMMMMMPADIPTFHAWGFHWGLERTGRGNPGGVPQPPFAAL